MGRFGLKSYLKATHTKKHAVRTVQNCFPCLSKMPTLKCSWTRSVVVKHDEPKDEFIYNKVYINSS